MEICKEYIVKFTREEIEKIEDVSNIINRIYEDFDDKISSIDGYLGADVENLDNIFRNVVENLSELRESVLR